MITQIALNADPCNKLIEVLSPTDPSSSMKQSSVHPAPSGHAMYGEDGREEATAQTAKVSYKRNNSLAPRSAIKAVSDYSMKSLDEELVTARMKFLVQVKVMRYLWTVVGFPLDN